MPAATTSHTDRVSAQSAGGAIEDPSASLRFSTCGLLQAEHLELGQIIRRIQRGTAVSGSRSTQRSTPSAVARSSCFLRVRRTRCIRRGLAWTDQTQMKLEVMSRQPERKMKVVALLLAMSIPHPHCILYTRSRFSSCPSLHRAPTRHQTSTRCEAPACSTRTGPSYHDL